MSSRRVRHRIGQTHSKHPQDPQQAPTKTATEVDPLNLTSFQDISGHYAGRKVLFVQVKHCVNWTLVRDYLD